MGWAEEPSGSSRSRASRAETGKRSAPIPPATLSRRTPPCFSPIAEQERVGDELERRQIDVARAGADEVGEAAVEAGIFAILADRDRLAGDGEAGAAVGQSESAGVRLHLDVPALRAGLAEIEFGGDDRRAVEREAKAGGDRRLAIGRDKQRRRLHGERAGQDAGQYRQRVDSGIEHAEAARLPDPLLARMPDADILLPGDPHRPDFPVREPGPRRRNSAPPRGCASLRTR